MRTISTFRTWWGSSGEVSRKARKERKVITEPYRIQALSDQEHKQLVVEIYVEGKYVGCRAPH